MLSPLPEIRDGEKGPLFAASSSSPLAGQAGYLLCLCLCLPQLLGWRWVYGKGSDVCALPQEDEQHAHNLSELSGGSTKLNRDRRLRGNQTLHVLS